MPDAVIDPKRTALINVDLQNAFVHNVDDGPALIERINDLATACRSVGIMVIHTSHVLRPDGSNLGLLRWIDKIRDGALNAGSETAALSSALDVQPGDVLLEKPRFGAFYGTDLELILRSNGINTLIVSGISSPVCCDTTAREAHARDFEVFFLSDGTACTGPDSGPLHQATLDLLDGFFAHVTTVAEVLGIVQANRSLA